MRPYPRDLYVETRMHRLLAGLTVALVLLTACTSADEPTDVATSPTGSSTSPAATPVFPEPSPDHEPSPEPSAPPQASDEPSAVNATGAPGEDGSPDRASAAPDEQTDGAASAGVPRTPCPRPAESQAFVIGPSRGPEEVVSGTVEICGATVHYDVNGLWDVGHLCEEGRRAGCRRISALISGCCVLSTFSKPAVAYDPDGDAVAVPDDWAAHLARFPWLDVRVLSDGVILVEATEARATDRPLADGIELAVGGDELAKGALLPVGEGFVIWATRGSVPHLRSHVHLVDSEIWVEGRYHAPRCPEPLHPADAISIVIERRPGSGGQARQQQLSVCGVPVALDVPEGGTAWFRCGLVDGIREPCNVLTLSPRDEVWAAIVRPRFVRGRNGEAQDPPADWATHLGRLDRLRMTEHENGSIGVEVTGDSPGPVRIGEELVLDHGEGALVVPLPEGFVALFAGTGAQEPSLADGLHDIIRVG